MRLRAEETREVMAGTITRIRWARGRVLSLLLLLVMVDVMAAQTPITIRDVTVAGTALHYLEAGPSGAMTVLLLHGARFTSETWRELGTIAELADAGHHVVAFDLPGYGNSGGLQDRTRRLPKRSVRRVVARTSIRHRIAVDERRIQPASGCTRSRQCRWLCARRAGRC